MERMKHTGNACNTKKSFSVTVNINSLDNVKQLSQSLPHEDRRLFTRKYGAILDLLVIPVETSALCVLAQYWNASLRSFELPNLDITPTIEEFACMMGLPMTKDSTVYVPPEHCIPATKVARKFGELLGLQTSQIKLVGHADSQGLTRAFMENYLKELEQRQEWVTFSRVLALTIYGLVLFPSALDMVDQAAMGVFFTVETKKINPVPAILAETFLTLDFCQRKQKGGKLRCCAQLLYVWIITHMYAGNHINSSSDPLRSFHRIPVKHRDEQEWKIEFNSVEGKTFKWICPWFETRRGDIIYSCGKFPNVPLIGPRGCITYTPAVVLKQLNWTQKQPREDQLEGYCFSYKDDDDTKALSREIKKAWGDVRTARRSELGKPLLINTAEYVAWREARRTSNNTPKAPARRNVSPQSTPQMVEQLELMRAQIPFLAEQKAKAELEVIISQSKCEKMAKEIERLKDECADMVETSRVKKGKQKVSETFLGRIRELEEEVQFRAKENLELKQGICQQDQAKEKLKMEVNRQKQAKEALERGKVVQNQKKKILEQRVEELTILLTQAKIDSDQGWTSSNQYHDLFVEATNEGRWWRSQALDREAEVEEWKKKYKIVTGELNHHVPSFVHCFEKANDQILVNPTLSLPSEVDEFMELCGNLTRSLKRKKRKLLM